MSVTTARLPGHLHQHQSSTCYFAPAADEMAGSCRFVVLMAQLRLQTHAWCRLFLCMRPYLVGAGCVQRLLSFLNSGDWSVRFRLKFSWERMPEYNLRQQGSIESSSTFLDSRSNKNCCKFSQVNRLATSGFSSPTKFTCRSAAGRTHTILGLKVRAV